MSRATTPEQKRALIEALLGLWLASPTERLGQLLLNSIPTGPRSKGSADEVLADIERRMYSVEDEELMALIAARLAK